MRRHRGDGTVCRRKDGRFEAATYVNTPEGIKRVRRYAATRTEAEALLVELRKKNESGLLTSSKEQKFGDYLDYWLLVVKPAIRVDTFKSYEATVRLYLKPGLGQKRLTKLSVADVQSFLNTQLLAGKSVRNIQKMKIVLSACLKRAEHEDRVSRNVARMVEIPTYKAKEVIPWSPAQLGMFLDAATVHPYYPIYVVLAMYGLRRNEALGLSWSDIDFDKKVIHIRQQLQYDKKTYRYADLKTRAGRRDLPLLDIIIEVLKNVNRSDSGPLPDLIFKTSSGLPIDGHNLRRSFNRISVDAGLPRITLHTLRHTAATNLKNLGIAARDAQSILGHAHISTTMQIYQHSDIEGKSKALVRYEEQIVDVRACSRQNKPSNSVIEATLGENSIGSKAWAFSVDPRLMSPVL